jgi:hypothetical protein
MSDNKNDSSDGVTYMLYRNGEARIVSKEAWERSWLSWFNRNQRSEQEGSSV